MKNNLLPTYRRTDGRTDRPAWTHLKTPLYDPMDRFSFFPAYKRGAWSTSRTVFDIRQSGKGQMKASFRCFLFLVDDSYLTYLTNMTVAFDNGVIQRTGQNRRNSGMGRIHTHLSYYIDTSFYIILHNHFSCVNNDCIFGKTNHWMVNIISI